MCIIYNLDIGIRPHRQPNISFASYQNNGGHIGIFQLTDHIVIFFTELYRTK